MNGLKKLMDKIMQKSNVIIAITGVILLISLIFVYILPKNKIAILTACVACGLMNVLQGFKYMNNPKKKTTGMSILMMGLIVIAVGFVIIITG